MDEGQIVAVLIETKRSNRGKDLIRVFWVFVDLRRKKMALRN